MIAVHKIVERTNWGVHPAELELIPHEEIKDAGSTVTTWTWIGSIVALRELKESDLPTLVEWVNDPRVAATQSTGPMQPQPTDKASDLFRAFSTNSGADVGMSIVNASDGEMVGHLMLYGTDPKDRCGTVSIMIGPPFQRKGFGHDALDILVRYAFSELGLHRLELQVNAFNLAGLALYQNLGFVEEGRRRSAIYRDGTWHDHVLMGLLACEWRLLDSQ